jgi:hypothetical protein
MAYDIESESLPAHVSLCQERYRALEGRLDTMEEKIQRIESLVTSIHDDLKNLSNRQNDRWSAAQVGVISVLIAVVGFLSARLFFQ